MIFDKTSALEKLCPDAKWCVRNDVIEWRDEEKKQPTEKEINDKIAELQAEYDSKQYQRDRATSYPSIQEQLDMQYHDLVNGTTTWKDAIAKVKTENPKSE